MITFAQQQRQTVEERGKGVMEKLKSPLKLDDAQAKKQILFLPRITMHSRK